MSISIHWTTALLALPFLSVGGWLLVGACLWVIRLHVFKRAAKDCWGRLDFWLGSAERTVAATMFVLGISSLPAFIGAWVAFKLAANWQRIASTSDATRKGTLIALIGNVISFGYAIVIGWCLNPNAINAFLAKTH